MTAISVFLWGAFMLTFKNHRFPNPYFLAKSISKSYGIEVYFSKERACSSPYSIRVPVFNHASEVQCDIASGYMLHELGHCLFSDFKAFAELEDDDLLIRICNALEDVRVEQELIQTIDGSKYYLQELNRSCLSFYKNGRIELKNFKRITLLIAYIIIHGQWSVRLYPEIDGVDCALERAFSYYLDSYSLTGLRRRVELLRYVQSTADVIELGRDIVNLMNLVDFFPRGVGSPLFDYTNLQPLCSPYCKHPKYPPLQTRRARYEKSLQAKSRIRNNCMDILDTPEARARRARATFKAMKAEQALYEARKIYRANNPQGMEKLEPPASDSRKVEVCGQECTFTKESIPSFSAKSLIPVKY